MTITIKIDTGNAAFEDNKEEEVKRILTHWMATDTITESGSIRLRDYNGNTVGSVTVRGK